MYVLFGCVFDHGDLRFIVGIALTKIKCAKFSCRGGSFGYQNLGWLYGLLYTYYMYN